MKTLTILAITALAFAHSLHAHDTHPSSPTTSEVIPDLSHGYHNIQIKALERLIHSANPSVIVVDARTPQYDDGKRLPGAKILPHDSTSEKLSEALPDKNAIIIVYCTNTHCPASRFLAERLAQMGYKNIWKYAGGIEEWETQGLSVQVVEKGKPASEVAKNS